MGRSVANEGFITAFLKACPYDGCHFFLADASAVSLVQSRLNALCPDRVKDGFFRVKTRSFLPDALAASEYAVFHLSDCVADTVPLIRLRNALSRSLFAVTGTTHSLSYARYPLYFFDQLWAGITKRDAVIATSRCAVHALSSLFSSLREGYKLDAEFITPQLALIPLGVNPEDFIPPEGKGEARAALRRKLAIPAEHVVFLVFARISHYSKMDILPIFRALIRAQKRGLPQDGFTLILSGWMDSGEESAAVYADIASRLGISFRLAPSPDSRLRQLLFAGADVFLSPVDNPQETFGLTMLEAGVASLPVIASDFDGYRDLIIHGETGFLLPTLGPGATKETDALSGVWFDNQYHLQLAQQSVVSVPAMAEAIALLAADTALRVRLGENARKHVLENFSWEQVVRRYLALWEELAATPISPPPAAHPLHPDYSAVFGGYYTRLLGKDGGEAIKVQWSDFGEAVYRGKDFPLVYAGIERLIPLDDLRRMLFQARKGVLLSRLLAGMKGLREEQALFLLLWALKHDLLEMVE